MEFDDIEFPDDWELKPIGELYDFTLSHGTWRFRPWNRRFLADGRRADRDV